MFKSFYGPVLYPKADRFGTYAAALAYCFVLSMVPFLALTFSLGMKVSADLDLDKYAEGYSEVLNEIIPTDTPGETKRIFEAIEHSYSTKGGVVQIGLILAAYTSFNLMEQIIRTLLFIFDDPRKPQEWSVLVVLKTIALLIIWMALLLLLSMAAVEASVLQNFSSQFLFSAFAAAGVRVLQVLVVIGALFGTFFLTYYLVPTKRYRMRLVVEGSLLASLGWVVCSLAFAYGLPKLLHTSAAYVALGSVVAILLWAQACAWSVIAGACWIVRFAARGR